MARYRVGDRVVVRDDLVVGNRYWMLNDYGRRAGVSDTFVTGMDVCLGKVVTIKKNEGKYRIEEREYNWTDEMFVGLEEDIMISDAKPIDLDTIL